MATHKTPPCLVSRLSPLSWTGGLGCYDFEVEDDLKSSDAAEDPLLLERYKLPFFLPINVSMKLDLHRIQLSQYWRSQCICKIKHQTLYGHIWKAARDKPVKTIGFSCIDFFFYIHQCLFQWKWLFIKVPVNTVHENISIILRSWGYFQTPF